MPDITVTVPAAVIPELVEAAEDWMDAQTPPINYSALSAVQKGKRYLAGILKDVVVSRRRTVAQTTAQSTIDSAVTTAQTDAAGIV